MSAAPALPGKDHESWHRRWKEGEIPWHQSSVHRTLEVRMDTRPVTNCQSICSPDNYIDKYSIQIESSLRDYSYQWIACLLIKFFGGPKVKSHEAAWMWQRGN